MSFSILLSLTQADDVSVNRMYRSITIFRYPSMEDCKIFSTWTVAARADKEGRTWGFSRTVHEQKKQRLVKVSQLFLSETVALVKQ